MRTTPKLGLTSWDQPYDEYNYAQLANNWQLVDFHDHSPGRGVPVAAGGLATGAVLSTSIAAGVVGAQHLSPTLTQDLGISATGRGAISIATPRSTASTVQTYLTPADQVTGIVLDSNGLIEVDYQALWKVSAGVGYAILVLNGVNVQTSGFTSGITASLLVTDTGSTVLSPLFTNGSSLATTPSSSSATEVTTGQTAGLGSVAIFAAAGTYSVGVQFWNSAGTTTVQNAHLWVTTTNFV